MLADHFLSDTGLPKLNGHQILQKFNSGIQFGLKRLRFILLYHLVSQPILYPYLAVAPALNLASDSLKRTQQHLALLAFLAQTLQRHADDWCTRIEHIGDFLVTGTSTLEKAN